MKHVLVCLATLVLALALPISSQATAAPSGEALLAMDFPEIEDLARGGEVRFYMYGGWAHVNTWIDTYVAEEMKKRHGIRVKRVPMDAAVFMNKLFTEKAAGKTEGSIDLLWINGENFKNAMEAGLLFGPFAEKLPNVRAYVDSESAAHDFGYPTKGYEAPYGKAQFVFEYDTARTPAPPRSFAELKEWVRNNPGRFTYPQPPDFTGSAFIRQVFYAVTGGYGQYMKGFDRELLTAESPKLWEYLNGLKQGLWQKGRTYPQDSSTLDTLFARGEVDFGMSYHPSHAQSKILDGTYPDTVRTFVMTDGAIYNLHFTAIPANAVNKAAAMVVSNFLLSPEAQLSKYDPANWGDFPAVSMDRLPREWQEKFKAVDLGPATLSPEELGRNAAPEIPAEYLEALEKGWEEHVLKGP